MKKLFTLIVITAAPFIASAQFSKKSAAAPQQKDSIANTVDLKLQLSSDTAKARIVIYASGDSDRFLSWVDGFIVVKTYKLPNGQVAGTVGNLAYSQKWELLKPEDIYDVKIIEQPKNSQSTSPAPAVHKNN